MKVSKKIYLIAVITSIILFISGLTLGIFLERTTFTFVEERISSVKNDLNSIQQDYLLLSARGTEGCSILSSISSDIASRLDSVLNELLRLERQGETGDRFQNLKNDYATLSIRSWILRTSVKETCGENVVTILYYYSIPCKDCLAQGQLLDKIKKLYDGKVATYVLDSNLDQPLVKTLIKSHNITKTPSLVINGIVYHGFVEKEKLNIIICSTLNVTCQNLQ